MLINTLAEDEELNQLEDELVVKASANEEILVSGLAGAGALAGILVIALTVLLVIVCRLQRKYSR